MPALALTDHGNMYGAIEFYKKARAAGLKPIIGCEAYIAKRTLYDKQAGIDDKRYHLVLLAKNNKGYQNLLELVTISYLKGFYYKPRLDKQTLKNYSGGLIGLSGCVGGEIPSALLNNDYKRAGDLLKEYRDIFGKDNFFIELEHHPGISNYQKLNRLLLDFAKENGAPVVAAQDVHYLKSEDKTYQEILLAIQTNSKLDDEDRLTMKDDDFSFRSAEEMRELFKEIPEAVENSLKIAAQCDLELKLGELKFPHFEAPKDSGGQFSYFKHLAEEGFNKKFLSRNLKPDELETARKRFEYEISVIQKTGFVNYFLIVQDFVNWAKSQGIVVGPGRGSTAGSLAAYCLNITDVNPLKYDLLFERFINPERISQPDIDLDFADTRRDEVLSYISRKYGEDKVAQIITFGTMASRAAIRDVGRALGLSYGFCDETAKMIPFGFSLRKALDSISEFKNIYNQNPEAQKLINSAMKLEGVCRHASTHACGIVIGEAPLAKYTPLQLAASQNESGEKKQAIVTQYEMRSIEDLGLLKMDILGLKNLSIIEETINLIKKHLREEVALYNLEPTDPKVFKTLAEGKTAGVFQLEGGGMTKYLKELRPTNIEDIIAIISLYRPGPMELVPSYIRRKQGLEKISYLHPRLEPILKNTYGIMIYQEQLMQSAQTLAGFSLAEADILRKAIGKKIKKLLAEQKEKIIKGVVKTAGSRRLGERFWELVEPFGGYGFNKSHSAAYALIAYQTAYLKTYYPLFLMTSLMNSDSKDVDRAAFLVKECVNLGIKVLPPDINESGEGFTPHLFVQQGEGLANLELTLPSIKNSTIRFGLRAIKNVGHNVVKAIIEERNRGGKYNSFSDFLERTPSKDLNKKSLEALVKSGALDGIGERNQLLFNLQFGLDYSRELKQVKAQDQSSLFSLISDKTSLPSLRMKPAAPASFEEKLKWEKGLLGLYISGHPLEKFKTKLEGKKMTIASIKSLSEGAPIAVAGIVEGVRKILTKRGEPMVFLRLLDLSDTVEIVVFPRTLEAYGKFIKEEGCVAIKGKISLRGGAPSVICDAIKEL